MPLLEADRQRLWYQRRGAGPPLVAIHGAGGSSRHWGYQLAALSGVADVVAVDLPGHGRSPGPALSSLAEMAECVLVVLDALALPTAICMGHSMGGGVAQLLALYAPARLEGLVLLATAAHFPRAAALAAAIAQDWESGTATVVVNAYPPTTLAATLIQAAAELRAVDHATLQADYLASAAIDVRAQVGAIAVPALVVAGSADQIVPPRETAELAARIGGAEFATIPRAGHMLMLEHPERVNHLIRTWIGRLQQS